MVCYSCAWWYLPRAVSSLFKVFWEITVLTTKQKIHLARWSQCIVMVFRRLLGKGHITVVNRNSISWKLDLREGIDFAIWLMGYFEPSTVSAYKRIIRPGDVVLDIGANIGAHTLPMAKLVGDAGKVIAFEPTNYAFDKLSENCALNPIIASRTIINQVMLVSSGYASSVHSAPDIYSSWPLKKEAASHEIHQGHLMSTSRAELLSLDDYVTMHNLSRLDFIKIDIDGFECEMFNGAAKTLKRYRPKIIMELAPYTLVEQGGSLKELISILSDAGYVFYTIDDRRKLPSDSDEINRMIPPGASINILAIAY